MELLTLNEIPELNGVFSDDKFLYVPLLDERLLLHAIISNNRNFSSDFGYNGITTINNQKYSIIEPSADTYHYSNGITTIINLKKELKIDGGIYDSEDRRWQNSIDLMFSFGGHYAYKFLWYKEKYGLPFNVETAPIDQSVPIDKNGYQLNKYCKENQYFFLHPIDMIHEDVTPQFFIPAFQKRYSAPFEFIGRVYEDDYNSWAFIEATQATLGQVFLLGVSWALNCQRIRSMLTDIWKSDPKSLYQYPVWFADEPDFSKKWPWSREYGGSAPELAVKYMRS